MLDKLLKFEGWRCPSCHNNLETRNNILHCERCRATYESKNNYINFLKAEQGYGGEKEAIQLRNFFKRWPKFYYFIANVFGPMMFRGLSAKKFINVYPPAGGISLNLGSGPRLITPEITNLDVYPYSGVEIVADIARLPLEDCSVSRVICDNVIEHVEEPHKVIDEIYRVLEKGGLGYITMLFLYPFHSSPDDFNRWSDPGFRKILKNFEIVESGVRAGAFSTLTVYLCYLFALLFSFGNRKLYWLLVNASIFIFFPIRYLDLLFGRLPHVSDMAAHMYYVVRKKYE